MKNSVLKRFCELEKKGGAFPLLPASFLWIGIGVCVLSILTMTIVALQAGDHVLFFKELCMHFILVGLFMMTLAKDKNEDERIKRLRYRAFAFAFVLGTFTLLMMRIVVVTINSIKDELPQEWEYNQSFFFIISSYLFYYLMYFQIFKKQL
ncbi:hypothetical protein [Nonlabens ulvanivorans]|uniref:Uncharacterized protein n=1 Tax=Nonlabens ulvanivorans TaxID=906888 RepID=A0A084JVN2_NONUL|nr:hypothetical protein [Nonlabens ulvanivorans]KEZ93016.1 hypothetical protein IL45_12880 [Nonlabens ulvanivorans]PRX12754.1 hypothetical protein LY02_02406 [Nonlabens ulvanivorans]